MIPLTFLYDEYIDRLKLPEQKKPIWVYSSEQKVVSEHKLLTFSSIKLVDRSMVLIINLPATSKKNLNKIGNQKR